MHQSIFIEQNRAILKNQIQEVLSAPADVGQEEEVKEVQNTEHEIAGDSVKPSFDDKETVNDEGKQPVALYNSEADHLSTKKDSKKKLSSV